MNLNAPETRLVCSKCGKWEEYHKALAAGWQHESRKDPETGKNRVIIRCPEHKL